MAPTHAKEDKMDMDGQNEVNDAQDQKETEDPTPLEVTSHSTA